LSDKNIGDPKDYFKVGQDVEAIIMTIAPSERKMGLSIKRLSGKDSSKGSSKKTKKPKKKTPGSLDIAGALEKAGVDLTEVQEEDEEESSEE
jgi:ribosomal protein S1